MVNTVQTCILPAGPVPLDGNGLPRLSVSGLERTDIPSQQRRPQRTSSSNRLSSRLSPRRRSATSRRYPL
jgi:hypothetical protein